MPEAQVERQSPIPASMAPGDVALLAARAALEIEGFIRNRSTRTTAITALAELIGQSAALVDPSAAVMMHTALTRADVGGTMPTTLTELVKQAGEMSAHLQATSQGLNGGSSNLAKMRAFCVALSQVAAAQEPPYHEPVDADGPELWTGATAALLAQEA